MKDFAPNTLGLKVLTPQGYQPFEGVAYMGDKAIYRLDFSNRASLECSATHRLITPNGIISAKDIRVGQWVYRGDGRKTRVKEIIDTGKTEPVFDLIGVGGGNTYVTEGVVSHNCVFVTDDETLIDAELLSEMKPTTPEFYTRQVRWYQMPLPNRTFLVTLDPSLGTGVDDYAAIQVFMLPEMVQIAEWQHNGSLTRDQVRVMMQILVFIRDELLDTPEQHGEPEIYWTVENNTIGEAILNIIEDTGEERFPGMFVSEKKRKGQTRRFRKGFNTDSKKKLSACVRFKSLVETGRMHLQSEQLINELKEFVRTEGSFRAKAGRHDDLVMAAILIVRMLDVVVNWSSLGDDLREYIADEELYENDPMPVVV